MSRKLPLFGLLSLLGASGCIIAGHPGQNSQGDSALNISLEPTFAGIVDCYQAGVDEVSASFDGSALPAATVPCNSAGGIAIAYESVTPGTYTVTLEGLSNGKVVYAGQGTFTVDFGLPTTFSFDLPLASGTTMPPTHQATVTLDFSFGSSASGVGMTCQQAQVTTVSVSVDGGAATSVRCHDSTSGTDTATLAGITSGTHSFDLSVFDNSGTLLYHSTLANETVGAGSNEITANLAGAAPGGLQLQWVFADASSCMEAGVSHMQYTVVGPDGQIVAQSATPSTTQCANSDGTNGNLTFDTTTGVPLAAGMYSITALNGLDAGGNLVYSSGAVDNLYVPAGALQAFQITLSR